MKGSKIKIIVDAMGGDFAPKNVILGAYQAIKETNSRFEIILAGDEKRIKNELSINKIDPNLFSFIDAPEVIDMNDSPTEVLKTKKNSSIIRGLNEIKEGKAHSFVSAGNTGSVLASATILLGRIKGVARPTIGVCLPGATGSFSLILDGGANVDCKAQYLYEFAIMGSIYLEVFFNRNNPSIGLLNVGEESSKGNSLALEAYSLLSNSGLNFIGNIEGSDIFRTRSDIVICDGFVGNIVLKFGESVTPTLKTKFYQYAGRSIFHKLWIALVGKTVKVLLRDFDYQKYGGVPLLGINGNVIIGHGKSSPLAIKNMIYQAEEVVTKELVSKIEEKIKELKNKKIIIEEDEQQ